MVSGGGIHEGGLELLSELHHALVLVVSEVGVLFLDFGSPFHNVLFVEVELDGGDFRDNGVINFDSVKTEICDRGDHSCIPLGFCSSSLSSHLFSNTLSEFAESLTIDLDVLAHVLSSFHKGFLLHGVAFHSELFSWHGKFLADGHHALHPVGEKILHGLFVSVESSDLLSEPLAHLLTVERGTERFFVGLEIEVLDAT